MAISLKESSTANHTFSVHIEKFFQALATNKQEQFPWYWRT